MAQGYWHFRNKKEFNAWVRKSIREYGAKKQLQIAKGTVTKAKKNVPPQMGHWPRRPPDPGFPYYSPKGRLQRNIRNDKRASGIRSNTIRIRCGVGRRGHVKHSAPIHEFGAVITGNMQFRIGPNGPLVHTTRVVIRPKKYLGNAILHSLRRYASNVRFTY